MKQFFLNLLKGIAAGVFFTAVGLTMMYLFAA